ncbi:MAG: hypothetical protein EVA26_02290 [Burkholderiaceae bacterium]|nr:MAG: hypothetical protein EVA26_02290 [Burkholderiaceae bacterium]
MKYGPLWQDISISSKNFLEIGRFSDLTPRQKYIRFVGIKRLALAKFVVHKYAKTDPNNNILYVVAISIALYEEQRYPEYTLVNQAVECLKHSSNRKIVAFGNFILRKIFADPNLFQYRLSWEQIRFNAPLWWINHLKKQVDDNHLQNVLVDSLLRHPPLNVRLNKPQYINQLSSDLRNINRKIVKVSSHGLTVVPPCDLTQTSSFEKGLVSIQDLSSQRIIDLIQPKPDDNLLDICAAPGGKSLAIATNRKCNVFSNDKSKIRLKLLEKEIVRIKDHLVTIPRVTSFNPLVPKQLNALFNLANSGFDYIILDAPCSGSGIQRRHPEIPWTKTRQQLATLVTMQSKLLDACWQILKNRGILIYCTCSIFYNEGEGQVVQFLKRRKNVNRKSAPGLIYPTIGKDYFLKYNVENELDNAELNYIGDDGFFYAMLEKQESS